MKLKLLVPVLTLALAACSRPLTQAEQHREEDAEAYHQRIVKDDAEAAYRKTPAYKEKLRAQEAKEAAAYKAWRPVDPNTFGKERKP